MASWTNLPVALVCFLWLLSPAAGQAAERNIVFVVTDDQSPTLGCYGDPVAQTPAIDAIAADGVLFRNAYATTASCSASRSVILSGLHNHRNGQYGHEHHYHKFASFADVGRVSLPNVLEAAGYRTLHIGKYHVAPESAYHFQNYIRHGGRNSVAMAEQTRAFLNADDERPFFLYFAPTDPHRSADVDEASSLDLPPNLFGNRPQRGSFPGVDELFYDPATVPVPAFLPDTPETRAELAQYYQAVSRVDQGVARLIEILKASGQFDKTLFVFTSDHGMAFPGGKTTVYEAGLRVPLVVRNPYEAERGFATDALVSHVDITPTLLDFAGAWDADAGGPRVFGNVGDQPVPAANESWKPLENRNGGKPFEIHHGRSWLRCLSSPDMAHADTIIGSHTFHEIQMYYPMRSLRDDSYKIIWNIASGIPFPFASDLWAASTWQSQYRQGLRTPFGTKTVGQYLYRPAFELYDLRSDPHESRNLATDPAHRVTLEQYQMLLKQSQQQLGDPWVLEWDRIIVEPGD